MSVKWRNRLYILFIVLSTCATFIGPIGASLHWSNDTMGFITSLVGMLSAISSILARNEIDMSNINDHIADKGYVPTHSAVNDTNDSTKA